MTKNKVDRASYHGGDLDGKNVSTMFQNNEKMFKEIQLQLKQMPQDERCTDSEIDDIIERYIEITTLFDYLFSIAHTPTGEASDDIINTARRLVDVLQVKWNDLQLTKQMPKIHALFTHLVPLMIVW